MIRSLLYDTLFGLPIEVATPNLYKVFLETVEENVNILEIGIGTGITLEKNAGLIKKKNIKIHGIDINDSYLQACQLRVENSNLKNNVTLELNNVLESRLAGDKYDYVLFMESYPVIPKESLKPIIQKVLKILKPSSKIVFIHNLVEEPEWNIGRAILKSNLKKLTTVEFGRLVVRGDFEKWCSSMGLYPEFIKMIGKLELPIPGLRSIRQYMYFWKPVYKYRHK